SRITLDRHEQQHSAERSCVVPVRRLHCSCQFLPVCLA
uniref:Transposase n=1 Tax=Globodera pallida TaxID=36090 RepID=A0A183BSS0_GLOPA